MTDEQAIAALKAALDGGRPEDVADAEVAAPKALFLRGCARALLGQEQRARADLEAARAVVGDACDVELLFLDVRRGRNLDEAVRSLGEHAARADDPALKARALHVLGLAESKLRRSGKAVDALLGALRLYRALGDVYRRAMVLDTLGMVHAAKGRMDHALTHYSLSLVDKCVRGDRLGMAITLGNLSRVHLKAGRFEAAIECIERNRELVFALGDPRGEARVHDDLGRALLGMGEPGAALPELNHALRVSVEQGFPDMELFVRKDLALTYTALSRFDEAAAELTAASALLTPDGAPFLPAMLDAARGELALRRGDAAQAVPPLERAVAVFERCDLPDEEISARLSLAGALALVQRKAAAEACLLRALRIARADGFARYLPTIREAMTRLELVEGAVDERRSAVEGSPPAGSSSGSAYVLRERLGAGAFGEVFRAYDAERSMEVAFKRLALHRLYKPRQRDAIATSARIELEAASRLRHPGVVRVLGIGQEPDGALYVVQELIHGRPLRAVIPAGPTAPVSEVLLQVGRIASALQALHEVGVVHRDLKPDNVLIREDGGPVLVDFGIAHVTRVRLGWAEGSIVGTLDYMAPEQAGGEEVDGRADLYALGVVLFEWLTGVRPLRLRGATVLERAKDLRTRPAPPIADFRPGLPPELESLVRSLLAKRPRERPEGADQVAAECEEIARRSS